MPELMADILTAQARSALMSRIRGKDTKPEFVVRRLVHAMGYRYRLHRRNLPGTPDLVFGPRRKVIFVHGCFWHWHPDPGCRIAGLPKSRLEFWAPKLANNRARDAANQGMLLEAGWQVLVIWECATAKRHLPALRDYLRAFLGPDRGAAPALDRYLPPTTD
jgi:DNA mismatch endonuclease (patch repair protein)